mmetsp:Transcript_34078/g.55196  ORF Transcript_34078/g.55196 Transcript_34078/m.55196 type:complete len:565 (-) Transcript_34078:155-1849(-)
MISLRVHLLTLTTRRGTVLRSVLARPAALARRELSTVAGRPSTKPAEVSSFSSLGLRSEVVNAVNGLGISTPTDIQEKAIPQILKGKDVVLFAQTGTGKTLGYLLPVIDQLRQEEESGEITRLENRPRALVIVPNRELALQVLSVGKSLSHLVKFRSIALIGGQKEKPQTTALSIPHDLLIATPGRLLEHRKKGHVFFTQVRHVVIDEADTLLDAEFFKEVKELITPIKGNMEHREQETQFIFASATLSSQVKSLLKQEFPVATVIEAKGAHRNVKHLRQSFVDVPVNGKQEALLTAIRNSSAQHVLVFCNTISSARSTEHFLRESGHSTANYHGGILPREREAEFGKFQSGQARILVCTDIASRGLDTTQVSHVIMFDFPRSAIDYIHRAGRTGRAGSIGLVTNLVTKHDKPLVAAIQRANKADRDITSEKVVRLGSKRMVRPVAKTEMRPQVTNRMVGPVTKKSVMRSGAFPNRMMRPVINRKKESTRGSSEVRASRLRKSASVVRPRRSLKERGGPLAKQERLLESNKIRFKPKLKAILSREGNRSGRLVSRIRSSFNTRT